MPWPGEPWQPQTARARARYDRRQRTNPRWIGPADRPASGQVKLLVERDRRTRRRAARAGAWARRRLGFNHGGRLTETPSTIAALPEVVTEVCGPIPVFVDGGFRRGRIYKALASAPPPHGRPFLGAWALSSRRGPRARNHAGRIQTGDGKCAARTCRKSLAIAWRHRLAQLGDRRFTILAPSRRNLNVGGRRQLFKRQPARCCHRSESPPVGDSSASSWSRRNAL